MKTKLLILFILSGVSCKICAQYMQTSPTKIDIFQHSKIFMSDCPILNNYISKHSFNLQLKDFILSDKDKYKLTFSNNFLFLAPPLVWNLAYGSNNPAKFDYFEGNAPKSLIVTENIFRFTSMAYPIFLPINTKHKYFKSGMITYLSGLAIYFTSWAYLMKNQNTELSKSPIMRFAPAYTPMIWLTGISLMSKSKIQFTLSFVFIALHVTEYIYRYQK